ncbi:MAG: AAA family ATPase [Saprospiraceae bacterium]|nr:AAA family ATPase [Saprospiraceae bacterium]
MQKYPIGIQDFKEIRRGGYIYIDKTEQIHHLLDMGKYYFLSRPRRFGKSLLLSTIEYLYQGERGLFERLWIENHWDWSERYPVVHIKMSRSDYQRLGLEQALLNEVERAAVGLGIELKRVTLKERFEELLAVGSKQGQVVLLVDEYDKPMIDYLSLLDRMEENRSILKQFYSVIKDSDSYLRFFLLTGVSRFSKGEYFFGFE